MSLSEQIKRVDGNQNSTLKTILEKLGVSPGTSKIDQYPSIANGISNKVSPNNILSSGTATSYGLSSSATANDVFVKIKSLIDSITSNVSKKAEFVLGSYTGQGGGGSDAQFNQPQTINLGFYPSAVFVVNSNNRFSTGDLSISIYSGFATRNLRSKGLTITNTGFKVEVQYNGEEKLNQSNHK